MGKLILAPFILGIFSVFTLTAQIFVAAANRLQSLDEIGSRVNFTHTLNYTTFFSVLF